MLWVACWPESWRQNQNLMKTRSGEMINHVELQRKTSGGDQVSYCNILICLNIDWLSAVRSYKTLFLFSSDVLSRFGWQPTD